MYWQPFLSKTSLMNEVIRTVVEARPPPLQIRFYSGMYHSAELKLPSSDFTLFGFMVHTVPFMLTQFISLKGLAGLITLADLAAYS